MLFDARHKNVFCVFIPTSGIIPLAMNMPPSKSSKRQARIRAWILANRTASIADTMKATGASQATISRLRKELIQAGLVEKFAHTPATSRDPLDLNAPETPGVSTDELLTQEAEAVIAGTWEGTRDQRRQKLMALIQHGGPDHIIRANNEVEKMDQRDATREDVGPPSPQTLDEGIDEVTDMIEALAEWGGEEAVKKAVVRGLERYKEEQKRRQKPAQQPEPIFEEA